MIEKCKDFLYKQRHYKDDKGPQLGSRQQPKGAELNDLHRYKVAQILHGGPYLDCRPRDRRTDPIAAEFAKATVQSIVEDNTNRYPKVRRRVVDGSQAVGTWYAMVHWDESRGPHGNVIFETIEPSRVFPEAGALDIHDPTCESVIIERHERPRDIRRKAKWKDTDNLWTDNRGRYGTEAEWTRAHGNPSTDDQYLADTVTVLYCYYRHSDETYTADAGHRDLPLGQQYMACPTCGHKDAAHDRMPDGSLPDSGMPCPACMNNEPPQVSYLYRVTREKLTDEMKKYPRGRLVIVAPYQRRTFYDDAWQAPCRSFPIWQQRAYESPYEQQGGTDTLLYWSLQSLMDALRRQAYEQMVTSKPIIMFAGGPDGVGLTDGNNQPFVYDDTNGQIAYANVTSLQGMVQQFQGGGMPASLPSLYQILSSSFYQTKGTGQVSFTPERSRDVAYASLKLQQESGDVAVDDHKETVFEDEGLFWGTVLDTVVHNAPIQWFEARFGPEAGQALTLLRAEVGANVDVIVGSPPAIKQGAVDELRALQEWDQLQNPALRRIAARKLGISPADEAQVEMERQKLMQTMGPPQGGPAMNGGPAPAPPAGMGAPAAPAM